MKKFSIPVLLLFATAILAASGKEENQNPILPQMGRTLIVVNDKASMLTGSTATAGFNFETIDMPVLFEKTIQIAGGYNYIQVWKELHADRQLSAQLAGDCKNFQWGGDIKESVSKELTTAGVSLVTDPSARAAVNRARIMHPVKFGQPTSITFIPKLLDDLFSGGSRYQQWEEAVVADLKKGGTTDSLLVLNLYMWGVRPGGSKVEDQSSRDVQERYWRTRDLAAVFSSRSAQTIVVANVRLVRVKTGVLLWSQDFSYSLSDNGLTADRILADHSDLFKHMSSCINKLMAENIRRELNGELPNDHCDCPKPQGI